MAKRTERVLIGRGSVEIQDITDSQHLIAYIGSTLQRQVVYDPNTNTYHPNYAETPIELVPELYLAGDTQNHIQDAESVTWYEQVNSLGEPIKITPNETYEFNGDALAIKSNILEDNYAMTYQVEIVYPHVHPDGEVERIPIKADIELVRLSHGEKGDTGVGIERVEEYYLLTQTDQPPSTNDNNWSTQVASPDKETPYLWNYERIVYSNGNTQDTNPVMVSIYTEDGVNGRPGVGIESITNYYLVTDQNTGISVEGNDWTTLPGTTSQKNRYLWNYELIEYTDGASDHSEPAVIGTHGEKGDTGIGIQEVVEWYLLSSSTNVPSRSSMAWSNTPTNPTRNQNYLWNYEEIIYTDGSKFKTEPVILSMYSHDGVSILGVENYYLVTDKQTGVGPGSEDWKLDPTPTTPEQPYLWNYERIVYSDGTTSETPPAIIGTHGRTGSPGESAVIGVLDNDSHTIPTDEQGENGDYRGAHSTLAVYEGTRNHTLNWYITATASQGITGELSGDTYTVTHMSVDSGEITFTATRDGYDDIVKTFTLAKNKRGFKGEDATLYSLTLDTQVIRRDPEEDTIDPSEVTVVATKQTGEDPVENAYGYFVVYEQVRDAITIEDYTKLTLADQVEDKEYVLGDDPHSYAERYRSTHAETELAYALQADSLAVVIEWYKDEQFTHLLDREVIPVISDGEKGEDGYTPVKGIDYFDGEPGQNGKSSFTYIRYSQHEDGRNMLTDPTDAKYIGIQVTQDTSPSQDPSDYNWSQLQGDQGVKGEEGDDGETSYLHIKYSNDGKTFTGNDGENLGAYIGMYVDFTKEDSLDPSVYTWNRIKGEKGDKGDKGDTGISITGITEHYLVTDQDAGVTKNTPGWTTDFPLIDEANPYLWNYEETHFSDGTSEETEPVILGHYGADGQEGAAGRGITGITEYYLTSDQESGVTRHTDGWSTAMTVTTPSQPYLWNYGKIEYTYGNPTYTNPVVIGVHGEKGDPGEDAVLAVLTTPDGTAIRNHEGTLSVVLTLYKGNTTVSPTTNRWYRLNPSASGDSYSGSGWERLSETGDTLIVDADDIDSTGVFMAIPTYGGQEYRVTTTLVDIVDELTGTIVGPTVLRNGRGEITLTQKIYDRGVEVDPNGTEFTYTWTSYNTQGVQDTSFYKTGKTITITADDVPGTHEIRCLAYKK